MLSVGKQLCYARGASKSLKKYSVLGFVRSLCGARNVEYEIPEWQQQASIYVHWPYCAKRCTYCNFNKYIDNSVDHERMRSCLIKETESLLKKTHVKTVTSIFFGGGTPSLALPSTLESVIETVSSSVYLPHDAEITMEANPTSTEASQLSEFKKAGINRLSLGMQSLDDADLKVLGREHTVKDSLMCLEEGKRLFPGRTSVDIMFGLPGQTVEILQKQLQQLLELCDDHISLYQLTLERGTALFKQVMNREVHLPSPEQNAELYEAAVEELEKNSFVRYEASNFARNGAESSHNKSYWSGSQYLGIGPGAHGRFVHKKTGERQARIQTLEPEPWMREVEKRGHGTRKVVTQQTKDILQEVLMLSLRTKEGLTDKVWNTYCPSDSSLESTFSEAYMVKMLQEEDFITFDNRSLRCTPKGLNVVDSIVPELLNILDKHWDIHYSASHVLT